MQHKAFICSFCTSAYKKELIVLLIDRMLILCSSYTLHTWWLEQILPVLFGSFLQISWMGKKAL